MGHSTTRAALIYQHGTSLRDKMIADEISRRAEVGRSQSGTQRARSGPVTWPDLRDGVSVSDRERPFVTALNGPLMARRSSPGQH
jgi:hypothetical protein